MIGACDAEHMNEYVRTCVALSPELSTAAYMPARLRVPELSHCLFFC